MNSFPNHERVFCNRTVNLKNIKAIGFDMDYTLALYKPEFEYLAYNETLVKLTKIGYPIDILSFRFDVKHMIRGLAIDKHNGNVFKMDRHRYVKAAFHGFKEIPREQRKALYSPDKQLSYDEPGFALIDTLFTLADAYLFSQLVDFKDAHPEKLLKPYAEIYKDVRHAIDLCHRDGSIKQRVADNPSKYILRDENLVPTLRKLKQAGRKLFIATNSLWNYTNVVMNYLFGNDTLHLNEDWTDLFDVVITGSAKPAFFMSHNPIYEVEPKLCTLTNVESLNPAVKLYQGGNFRLLNEILSIRSGSEILYVGDHIYGDILRSKKHLGWRTMLVVAELEQEMLTQFQLQDDFALQEELLDQKNQLQAKIEHLAHPSKDLKSQLHAVKDQHSQQLKRYHESFHPIWGQLMKTGRQNSRFAAQVENYACLYATNVSSLFHYSTEHLFLSNRDFMPHD